MNDARRKRSRRSAGRRSANGTGTRVPFFAAVLALAVAAFRFLLAQALHGNPVLLHPLLDDGLYRIAAFQLQDSTTPPSLLHGSFLYSQLLTWIPGILEGRFLPLTALQAAIEGLTTFVLVTWISRRWCAWAGGLAGLLYLIDPLGGFFAARLIPVAPATSTFVLAVAALDLRAGWRRGIGGALLFGTLCGLGALLMPAPFLFLALLGAGAAVRARTEPESVVSPDREADPHASALAGFGGQGWTWGIVTLVPVVVLVGLVLVRNADLRDGGPALGWGAGVAVSRAFDPETGGTPRRLEPPSWEVPSALRGNVWETRGSEGTDYDVYHHYLAEGLRQAVSRPIQTIGTLLVKSMATVGAWPIPDALSPAFLFEREAPWARYGEYTFAMLLAVGLAGWIGLRGSDPTRRALGLGLLAVALACLFAPTSAAQRQPGLPLLAAMGGGWIAALAGRTAARPPLRTAVVAVALAAASIGAGLLSPTARLRNISEEYRLTAHVFTSEEQWANAIPLLEFAKREDPRNQEVRVILSRAYQREGLFQAAEDELQASLEIDDTHRPTLLSMAGLEQSEGNVEQAIEYVSRLLRIAPRNPLYLNELGQMLFTQGRVSEAKALFVQALTIKPDYFRAQENLEKVETMLLEMERQIFPPEMSLPPNDPINAMLPRVIDAMDEGSWAAADSLIQIIEGNKPNHVISHWLRAALYYRTGRTDAALTELEVCNQLAPGRPAVVGLLAQLYVEKGRAADARRLIERSLDQARVENDDARIVGLESIQEQLFAPPAEEGNAPAPPGNEP